MIPWVVFALGFIGYGIFSFIVLRVAYQAGHDGDLTVPVSLAYAAVSLLFWISAGVSLGFLLA
jgi:hypothetical protein